MKNNTQQIIEMIRRLHANLSVPVEETLSDLETIAAEVSDLIAALREE